MHELMRLFTDAKTVDSRALNLAGAQPFRAVAARLFHTMRPVDRDQLSRELSRTGIVVLDDFLLPGQFAATVEEAATFVGSTLPRWLHHDGSTEARHFLLGDVDERGFPHLAQWRDNAQVLAMAATAERRAVRRGSGHPLIEDIVVGDGTPPDPQTVLHIDAVFNTHKVWLYLDDVDESNGPLVYVPGSHRLDLVRLAEEYRSSIRTTDCPEESRRVGADELRRRGLERRVVTCRRNTLVIANTCGYHCRLTGEPGATRRALHMSFRFDPFRYPMPRASRLLRRATGGVTPPAVPAEA